MAKAKVKKEMTSSAGVKSAGVYKTTAICQREGFTAKVDGRQFAINPGEEIVFDDLTAEQIRQLLIARVIEQC